jgi:hypothetical protein
MNVRVIKVKFAKPCEWCKKRVDVDTEAYYSDQTKDLWHIACGALRHANDSSLDEQNALADKLGFRKVSYGRDEKNMG